MNKKLTSMSTITLTIYRDLPCLRCCPPLFEPRPDCPECNGEGVVETELECEVEYTYHRACRGARDRYGVPLEPDDPEGAEINSEVETERGTFELTNRELERAEKKCLEDAEETREERKIAVAEARYDAMHDR